MRPAIGRAATGNITGFPPRAVPKLDRKPRVNFSQKRSPPLSSSIWTPPPFFMPDTKLMLTFPHCPGLTPGPIFSSRLATAKLAGFLTISHLGILLSGLAHTRIALSQKSKNRPHAVCKNPKNSYVPLRPKTLQKLDSFFVFQDQKAIPNIPNKALLSIQLARAVFSKFT